MSFFLKIKIFFVRQIAFPIFKIEFNDLILKFVSKIFVYLLDKIFIIKDYFKHEA